MPRSFALGEHFETFIDSQVKSGRYNNASEVVRDGLRLLEDFETVRQGRVEELRRLIDEARDDVDNGRVKPADEVFDRLLRKYAAMLPAGESGAK